MSGLSMTPPKHFRQPMRWLITGGCGFIGTSLISKLNSDGNHFIRVLDNLSVGSREDLASVCSFQEVDSGSSRFSMPQMSSSSLEHPNPDSKTDPCQLIVGDILDEELAIRVVEDIDVIVHLAANTGVGPSVENPRLDCVTNVIGTLNYLEAARQTKVRRFVLASSGAPVGECTPPIHEELPAHPVSPYGASKLAGEGYCSAYFSSFGLETVALRFGNVYGPASAHKNSVVAKFIKNAMNGECLEIYGSGKQTRDFIFITDLVNAILLAANKDGIGGEVFQIATNEETTVAELVNCMLPVLEEAGITKVEVVNAEKRRGDVMRNFSDTTKAREVLGWIPKVSLVMGLKQTVDFFMASLGR